MAKTRLPITRAIVSGMQVRIPLVLGSAIALAACVTRDNPAPAEAPRTQIVLLGTGSPIPDPDRSGPATAIIVDSVAYLFDAGAGVVRRAAAAGREGVAAFAGRVSGSQPNPRFDRIFITHLHSDHTLGLADAVFTPWIQGRALPVDIYGPTGLQHHVTATLDAYSEDIRTRVSDPGGPSADGWKAVVHEIGAGEVYRDARVTVRAFEVPHSMSPAFAYRIDTPDRSIVISGDTRESGAVAEACSGCDVLIHEVFSDSGLLMRDPARQEYHAAAHTSGTGVGRIATKGRAGMVILTHILLFGSTDDRLLREVRSTYDGPVVLGRDLGRF